MADQAQAADLPLSGLFTSAGPSDHLTTGPVASGSVASRVRASWQRSRSYGVSPEHVEPIFTGSLDTGSLLYECGLQVLEGLHATLAGEPVSLMIADRDGLVLTRLCNDRAINRSLDKVHLAPGFFFTERNAGTNGLGLSLADRAPTLVRGSDHYCSDLQGYTCAAVPVLDPLTGDLAGSVNLTTWADTSAELLLALAQSAASNTSHLMLLRATGGRPRPAPRGEVARVCSHVHSDSGDAAGTDGARSRAWNDAITAAERAMSAGQVVVVVGESGAGKSALASTARRRISHRERLLSVRPPAPEELESWLALWTPELRHADTCVLVAHVESLPAWSADELATALTDCRRQPGRPQGFVLTAADFASIPKGLRALVDTVVEAPPLRSRTDDILPLARYFARQERHREVVFTPMAIRALTTYHWPDNVTQLERVARQAAARTDIVDTRHLPPEVFSGTARPLNRLDSMKRDEIIRCLTEPGATVAQAAAKLGMGRATVYRKIAQYDIRLPGRAT
ncbi:energy-coupling factor transporter ATP-binding protein EcfA2 [Nakamurella sp. UYEF19]|uniref:GAF domain-containing protein n=1 Tax=Nakamurella sp. UYEF19 TaxID=1756392 RepID=UPI003394FCD5